MDPCRGLRVAPARATMDRVSVKLLAIPASHPCAAVEAILAAKSVRYERVDLIPGLSRAWLRLSGFPGATVPAMRVDGGRLQGTRTIARAVDSRWPEPALFPADPSVRAHTEAIEAWADGPLQALARRIALWALIRSRAGVRAALTGARLQFRIPVGLAALPPVALPVLSLDATLNRARRDTVRADLHALPHTLDRIDEWIAAGDVDRVPPTAADYQIAGSIRLLLTLADLDHVIAGRPVRELARRLIPAFPGDVPAGVLPAAWLP
jgi:glutathione S-transferase